jgi:phospholipase C
MNLVDAKRMHLPGTIFGPPASVPRYSLFAKENFVAHTVADQSSIFRFIEDNWTLPQIGDQSFDAFSGSILNLFDFSAGGRGRASDRILILDPDTGEPQ